MPTGNHRAGGLRFFNKWDGGTCEDITKKGIHHWDRKRVVLSTGKGKPGEEILSDPLSRVPQYEKNHLGKGIKEYGDFGAKDSFVRNDHAEGTCPITTHDRYEVR